VLESSPSESGVKSSAASGSRQESAGIGEASISEVSASPVRAVALGSAADARVAAKATERSTAHARTNARRTVVVGWFIVKPSLRDLMRFYAPTAASVNLWRVALV